MNEDDPVLAYLQQYGGQNDDPVAAYLSRYGEQSQPPGKLESFGRGVAQGATLGFADELSAGIKAAGTLLPGGRPASEFGEAFSENVEGSRARDDAAREAHGGLMLTGELAGAIAPAVAGGAGALALRGARGATTAARGASSLGRLAASGAGLGALEATGRAEGNLVERLPSAAGGAVIGGVTGAALPFVGKGLRKVGTAFGVNLGRPTTRAADDILDALEGDPSRLASRASGAAGETAMDLDEGVRALGRTTNLYPHSQRGAMRDFLEERGRQQLPRVQEALEGGTGIRRQNTGALIDAISERQKAAAKELYDEAYQYAVPREVLGDVDLVNDDLFRDAYERGIRIAQRRGEDIGAFGAPLAGQAGLVGQVNIPVQAIDYMKRGLNDAIRSRIQRGGMAEQEGLAVAAQVRAMLKRVDDAVPVYGEARATWAGEEALKEAAQLGRARFHLDSPGDLARLLDTMTPSEVEGFRRGAVDNVLNRLGNVATRRDLLKTFVDDPNDLARMQLLFDDPAEYQRFVSTMGSMARQGETADFVLRGSQTANKMADRTSFEGEGVGSSFSPRGILDAFGGGRRVNAATEKAEAMAPLLTREDLPSLVELLEGRASARARAVPRREALTRAGALGGVTLSDLVFGSGER